MAKAQNRRNSKVSVPQIRPNMSSRLPSQSYRILGKDNGRLRRIDGDGLPGSPYLLLVFRALSGAAATMWVAFTVMFSSYFDPDKTTLAMGIMNSCASFGQLIAFAGGAIAQSWGWRAPFLTSAIVALFGLILMIPLAEPRPAERRNPAGTEAPCGKPGRASGNSGVALGELLAVGRIPSLLIVSGLAAIIQYVTFVTVYGFTPVYADRIGATRVELGILSFVTILPNTIASLVTGSHLTRRFATRAILITGFVLAGASSAAVPLINNLWLLNISQAIGGWARGAGAPDERG